MNRKQLAKRLREHAELHEELSEHRDEEQLQWEHDLRAAADIVEAEDGGREMKCDETPKLSEREAEGQRYGARRGAAQSFVVAWEREVTHETRKVLQTQGILYL